MPLYEYRCEECDEEFELIRSASDSSEVRCPSCDGRAEKKLSLFSTGATGRTCSPGSGGSYGGG